MRKVLVGGVSLVALALACSACKMTCADAQRAVEIARSIGADAAAKAIEELQKAFPDGSCAVPTPPAPGAVCPLDGQTADPKTWCGCWETSGRTDGDWKYTGDCPSAPPTTTPGTNPTTPPPEIGGVLFGHPGAEIPGYENTLGEAVNRAMVKVDPLHCSAGRCVINMDRQTYQAAVEAQLRQDGYWSGQHEKTTDEIAVAKKRTDPWQGFHVYADTPNPNVGTAFFSTCPDVATGQPCLERPGSSYRGAYASPWSSDPEVPGPAPTPACGAPAPPPLSSFGMKCFDGRPGTTVCDATPKVHGKDYCAAVGYIDGRQDCPVRPDCDPKAGPCRFPDRAECEAMIMGGGPVWTWTGDPSQYETRENPYTVAVTKGAPGTLTVCNAAHTVCATRVQ